MSHWCRDQARPQVEVGASLGERGLIASPTKAIAHPMNDSSVSAHTERCSRRKAWDVSSQVSSAVLPSSVHHASSPKSLQARAEFYLNWASFSHARIRPHLRLSPNSSPSDQVRREASAAERQRHAESMAMQHAHKASECSANGGSL